MKNFKSNIDGVNIYTGCSIGVGTVLVEAVIFYARHTAKCFRKFQIFAENPFNGAVVREGFVAQE